MHSARERRYFNVVESTINEIRIEENTMSKIRWVIGTVTLGATLAFGFVNVAVYADKAISKSKPKPNAVYQEECGACHFAYPAGFLPEQSWKKILAHLDDHFGENAELDKETSQVLSAYLSKRAMQKSLFNRFLRNFPKGAPTRITKLPFFIRKHDEVPSRMVKGNPKVGSFSQCDKCHQGATRGDFDEDSVKIPGYSRWED